LVTEAAKDLNIVIGRHGRDGEKSLSGLTNKESTVSVGVPTPQATNVTAHNHLSKTQARTAAPRFAPASVAIIPSTAKPATLAITLHTDLFICWRRAHRVDISAA
jgi:hypothetical protein